MRRYHQETAVIRRHHREHLRAVHGWPQKPVDCVCDLQAGRFRKKDAYDCGQTMCRICHYDKWCYGGHVETRQEAIARLRLREGLREI